MGKYFHIHGTALRPIDRLAALLLAAVLLMLLAFVVGGCSEPVTMYQIQGTCVSTSQRVLVMPFMDTRTFTDSNDPHREDLGEYARDIYVQVMRENPVLKESVILTPTLPKQTKSLTSAEVADIGRQHGADVVVTGQVFSFTETRAASIPPRAGMFVRLVSAADGAILFVGDHYQAAPVPGAPGGRDLQARNVAERLIEGMVRQGKPLALRKDRRISSSTALAMLAPRAERGRPANKGGGDDRQGKERDRGEEWDPIPKAPPFLELGGGVLDPSTWDDQAVPEVPPILEYNDDFYNLSMKTAEAELRPSPEAEPLPLPPPPDIALEEDADIPMPADAGEPGAEEVDMAQNDDESGGGLKEAEKAVSMDDERVAVMVEEPEGTEPGSAPVETEPALTETEVEMTEYTDEAIRESEIASVPDDPAGEIAGADTPATTAAHVSGDALAADLFATEGEVWAISHPSPSAASAEATVEAEAATAPVASGTILESHEAYLFVEAEAAPEAAKEFAYGTVGSLDSELVVTDAAAYEYVTESDMGGVDLAYAAYDDGPIYSLPLAVEQPRTFRSADLVELPDDPGAARTDTEARVATPARDVTDSEAVRILVLPYHDRENTNNLIPNTGGGEVVTTLYGAQLSQDPGVRVMWDATGQATHDRLVDKDEAVQLGRMVGADFVMRGEVVEFRRAQSVPSFYSAVISTAVLAAQMFFAEMSGVDVATEVYRVSDGVCVMSRRDRAQQKYVVQSEKTVRKLAAGMSKGVIGVVKSANPDEMDPLIDTLEPVTVLTNPR